MHTRRMLVPVALALALAGRAHAKELRIAVLEIRPLGTETAKAELLSEIALTEASSMGFDVIGKSDIASVIGFEKQKQVMGCSEDSTCLAEIGGALGVDMILVGSLGTLGDLFRLDLKLVDTKKARVRSRIGVTVEGKEGKLVAAVQKAVQDLLAPLRSGEPRVAAGGALEPRAATRPGAGRLSPAPVGGIAAPAPAAPGARRRWAYISGGTGLALLAGGVVAGLQARSALDDEKAAGAAGNAAAYDDAKSKVRSMSLLADGLFVAGAAGVGVGTWFWLSGRSPAAVQVGFAPLPGGAVATVQGGF